MGEIASDYYEGRCCAECSDYFWKNGELFTHGFPTICRDCFRQMALDDFKESGYSVSNCSTDPEINSELDKRKSERKPQEPLPAKEMLKWLDK